MNDFNRCLERGRIVRVDIDKEMIKRELSSADYDLEKAEGSLKGSDFKWAAIQAYYSMFHVAKGLVLSRGYREKSHYCLMIAIEELFIKPGLIKADLLSDFEMCLSIRHEADYGLEYSPDQSRSSIETAHEWIFVADEILRGKK